MGLTNRLKRLGERFNVDVKTIEQEAEQRARKIGLERLKVQGYDTCKICGEEVPVYKDDQWADIFNRLQRHANERDDHVEDPDKGWVLADGE